MVGLGVLRVFRAPGRQPRCYPPARWLSCLLLLAAPLPLLAQSADLLRAYQHMEAAKAAGALNDALRYGDEAVRLSGAAGDTEGLDELLLALGDLATQANQDERALRYYDHALALKERKLGAGHPDLIPLLGAQAELRLKQRRYEQAEALEQRILDIERQAYGERHANVLATLVKLQQIYRLAGDAANVARIQAQLETATSHRGFPGPADLSPPFKQSQGFATVRVFYGTNRAPSGEVKPALYYGKARGDLQYGYLDVTIPQLHKEAELETQPRWAEYIFDAGALRSRYVLLDKVVPLAKSDFVRELQGQIRLARSKDVFIFVHGFNNTFEDSARRAAQLVYDLDFDGTPLLYSWPSLGSPTAYTADEAAVDISGRKLAEFLDTVIAASGAQRVHLLAHSMGSRALIAALQTYLAKRDPQNRNRIFGQIVFTAPDVDRDYFMDAIPALEAAADRITLYASANDYALRSSQFLHDAPRAGTAGAFIVRLRGLDTIDMSSVPADVFGHEYFAANSGAIFDLFRLLWRGDPPPRRCGMSDRGNDGPLIAWVFDAQACAGLDMLEAGVLLKRFGDLARQRVVGDLASLSDPAQKEQLSLVLRRLDGLLATIAVPVGATK
jgi:esterase/lipase superfamily enzyme